jgi:predicted NAD-dependent protein-ADP-ribosyltransferase YbiA (DUF1768 family)
MERIYGFDGETRWLSNFWVEEDGRTVEHWFQAAKTLDGPEADLDTGDIPLVEANTWNDLYWGVDADNGNGQNMLGILLMQVRDEIRGGYV